MESGKTLAAWNATTASNKNHTLSLAAWNSTTAGNKNLIDAIWTISFHFIGQSTNIWLFNWALILVMWICFLCLGTLKLVCWWCHSKFYLSAFALYRKTGTADCWCKEFHIQGLEFYCLFPNSYMVWSFLQIILQNPLIFFINIYTGSNAFIRVFLLASQCSQDSPATKEETPCILKCIGLAHKWSPFYYEIGSLLVCVCIYILDSQKKKIIFSNMRFNLK